MNKLYLITLLVLVSSLALTKAQSISSNDGADVTDATTTQSTSSTTATEPATTTTATVDTTAQPSTSAATSQSQLSSSSATVATTTAGNNHNHHHGHHSSSSEESQSSSSEEGGSAFLLRTFAMKTKMPLEKITIESANKKGPLPVYVSSVNQKAGVIVIQEWWGVNEEIEGLAESWFADKYVVLVPDLYRGNMPVDKETAGHLFSGLDWQGAVQDIQGAVDYLRSKGVEKVGITGFSMGGALTIASGVLVSGLDAAVPFYGIPSAELADPGKIKVPVQCHFGLLDQHIGFSDREAQDNLERKFKENNVNYEFHRYPDADHGFVNENRERYNEAAAKLAHQRSLEFFEKHLH